MGSLQPWLTRLGPCRVSPCCLGDRTRGRPSASSQGGWPAWCPPHICIIAISRPDFSRKDQKSLPKREIQVGRVCVCACVCKLV